MMWCCKDCKHFVPDSQRQPYGSCARWNVGYGYDTDSMPHNEVLVENDEGWGMLVGPNFGCVLFEPR
jgi:hypothetical protein